MFILLSIRSIFSSMFITLLVATTTLDGLPPYRMVLNCFHLFWTIVLIYFELILIYTAWLVLSPYYCSYIQVIYFQAIYFQVLYIIFTTILLCFRLFPLAVRPLPPCPCSGDLENTWNTWGTNHFVHVEKLMRIWKCTCECSGGNRGLQGHGP